MKFLPKLHAIRSAAHSRNFFFFLEKRFSPTLFVINSVVTKRKKGKVVRRGRKFFITRQEDFRTLIMYNEDSDEAISKTFLIKHAL